MRKPKPLSGPIDMRKPAVVSGPVETRKPIGVSGPLNWRKPRILSGPDYVLKPLGNMPRRERKPSKYSGPIALRKPLSMSGPFCQRKPSNDSGPDKMRQPLKTSGPYNARKPKFSSDIIRQLVEVYYDVQDMRIRSYNRLRQVGEVKGVTPEILKEFEKQIRDYIAVQVRDIPIVKEYLRGIKGIGPILSGGLIAWFNPHKAPHASSFWKYAGLHVVEGKAVKREKGVKLGFSIKLRSLMWKIGKSFIKARTPFYRELYDEAKDKENEKLGNPIADAENCPMYQQCVLRLRGKAQRLNREVKTLPCKQHIDYRAMRKMIKRFLADLWITWRRLEGLSTNEPYVIGILHHSKSQS